MKALLIISIFSISAMALVIRNSKNTVNITKTLKENLKIEKGSQVMLLQELKKRADYKDRDVKVVFYCKNTKKFKCYPSKIEVSEE